MLWFPIREQFGQESDRPGHESGGSGGSAEVVLIVTVVLRCGDGDAGGDHVDPRPPLRLRGFRQCRVDGPDTDDTRVTAGYTGAVATGSSLSPSLPPEATTTEPLPMAYSTADRSGPWSSVNFRDMLMTSTF